MCRLIGKHEGIMDVSKRTKLLLLLIFLGGYVSLSFEIVVLRQLAGFVGSTAIITSIVIGIFLAFMSWGYYDGSERKISDYAIRRKVAKYFLLIALVIVLASSYVMVDIYFMIMPFLGVRSHVMQTFVYSLVFLSVVPYWFGKITALLSRFLHRNDVNFTGKIMAIDTVGSFLGSIAGTLIIMPFFGVNYTIMFIVFLALFASIITSKKQIFVFHIMVAALAIMINSSKLLYDLYGVVESNSASTTSVIEADDGKSKLLIINGQINSKISEDDDLRLEYMKYVEDNFIFGAENPDKPKDILILGAGGFTMGLKDEFNEYTFVDIDGSLKRISEDYFLDQKLQENKKFVVQDANQFLKEDQKQYDLIMVDAFSFLTTIPQDLITVEFFNRVKKHIKPNGIMLMNVIGAPNFSDEYSRNIDNTIRYVFKDNLGRQIMGEFKPWDKKRFNNIIYSYYNYPNSKKVYTMNKNAFFYDTEFSF